MYVCATSVGSQLLQLADSEMAKIMNNVPSSRGEGDIKSIEKDVKTINSLIVKGSKWIKIHMIYKKLSQDGGAGQAFLVRRHLADGIGAQGLSLAAH